MTRYCPGTFKLHYKIKWGKMKLNENHIILIKYIQTKSSKTNKSSCTISRNFKTKMLQ